MRILTHVSHPTCFMFVMLLFMTVLREPCITLCLQLLLLVQAGAFKFGCQLMQEPVILEEQDVGLRCTF